MNADDLLIVNYCHPGLQPLHSITRLPETEAYRLARELSEACSGTAFGRFADFHNYYPKRIRTEEWLYDRAIALGVKPEVNHPLYFVLHGSSFLDDWFGNGPSNTLLLRDIDPSHVTFTFGDSMTKMDSYDRRDPFTKDVLRDLITSYNGTVEAFLGETETRWRYIEVQLWSDRYLKMWP